MAITVAHIPNLECEAFYFDMERRGVVLVPMEPSAVAGALEQGEVDAGPVSLLDIERLASLAATISGFCVASVTGAPSSVLLSRAPVNELSNRSIAVDDPDPTGLQLLRVLLTQKHGVSGTTFVGREDEHDAVFLTGNQGLRGRRAVRGYPVRLDLGKDWGEWTGLPFVFSRWLVREGMERQDFLVLQDALFVGQEDWMNNLYKSTGPRNDLLMLPREVLEYVQGMRFFMGVPEEKAVELFQEKLARLDDAG
jgi:chorismate dehydratase